MPVKSGKCQHYLAAKQLLKIEKTWQKCRVFFFVYFGIIDYSAVMRKFFIIINYGMVAFILTGLAGCYAPDLYFASPMQKDILRIYGSPPSREKTSNGGQVWLYRFPVLNDEQIRDLQARQVKENKPIPVNINEVRAKSDKMITITIEFDRQGYVRSWKQY